MCKISVLVRRYFPVREHTDFWLLLLETVAFDFGYIFSYSPIYSYCGAILDIAPYKMLMAWAATILLLAFSETLQKCWLSLFYKVFLGLSAIPSLAIYGLKNENTNAFLLIFLFWICMYGTIRIMTRKQVLPCNGGVSLQNMWENHRVPFTCAFIWLVVSSLYFSWKYGGFRLFIRFEDVYNYRLDSSTQIDGALSYIFAWNVSLLIPFSLLVSLEIKKYVSALVIIMLTFMSYSIGGNKIVLLYMIIALGIHFIWKFRLEKYILQIIELSFSAVIVISTMISGLFNKNMFSALVYRMFSLPAEIHYDYYDFFRENPLLFLRQSILSRWFTAPYDTEASVIIGSSTKYFFVGDYNNASNGLFSTAYANFGWIGVIASPILIAVTAWVLFRAIQRWDARLIAYICLFSCLFLQATTYTSWLLTGGVILTVFVSKIPSIKKKVLKATQGGNSNGK